MQQNTESEDRHNSLNHLNLNGCRFSDEILKCIFLKENVRILIKVSLLKFVHKVLIDNQSASVQAMAWHLKGSRPLTESVIAKISNDIWGLWHNELKFISEVQFCSLIFSYVIINMIHFMVFHRSSKWDLSVAFAYTQWNDVFITHLHIYLFS